jgi:hypothetical protein
MKLKLAAVILISQVIVFASVKGQAQSIEYVGSTLWCQPNDMKTNGDFAYTVFVNGLEIFDISNPDTFVYVSKLYLQGEGYGITLEGTYAYIADGSAGMHIVDISDQNNAILVGTYDTPGTARNVLISESYAYISDGLSGLQIVDISNPSNPTAVGSFDTPGYSYEAVKIGNYVYIADHSYLEIVSVVNPARPIYISQIGQYFLENYGIASIGNYIYMPDIYQGLTVFDVSNPSNPHFTANIIIDHAYDVSAMDSSIYVISAISGLTTLNAVSPGNPVISCANAHIYGNSANVQSGSLFATSRVGGLTRADISDISNPVIQARYSAPDHIYDFAISGNYIYVPVNNAGLYVFDASSPGNQNSVGHCNAFLANRYVSVEGAYCFLAGWGDLGSIDISNPAQPALVNVYYFGSSAEDITITGNYAYILSGFDLSIVDISNPDDPHTAGNYVTEEITYNSYASGHFLYLTTPYASNLHILDITNPVIPTLLISYHLPGSPAGLEVVNNYAYIAGTDYGLMILDISDPLFPLWVGNCATPDIAEDVCVSGHYAFVPDYRSGLQIIDIANPVNPILVGSIDTPGWAKKAIVNGEFVYLINDYSIITFRFSATGISELNDNPFSYSLSQNYPNPFNAQTSIKYALPQSGEVEIAIYNIMGQKVAVLSNGIEQPGEHTAIWDAKDMPSGVYFAKLQAGEKSETIIMVLLK